ncbi:MAG: hypothetical protein U0802_13970 [Candidatus Binatia bacterium]
MTAPLMMRILSVAALAVALFSAQPRSPAPQPAAAHLRLRLRSRPSARPAPVPSIARRASVERVHAAVRQQRLCGGCGCASAPAAAPSLDANGLAAAIVLLSGLAGLRLRRRAATTPLTAPPPARSRGRRRSV